MRGTNRQIADEERVLGIAQVVEEGGRRKWDAVRCLGGHDWVHVFVVGNDSIAQICRVKIQQPQ